MSPDHGTELSTTEAGPVSGAPAGIDRRSPAPDGPAPYGDASGLEPGWQELFEQDRVIDGAFEAGLLTKEIAISVIIIAAILIRRLYL